MTVRTYCALVLTLALGGWLASVRSDEPKYPHVSLATTYEVDAAWPKKPKDFQWGPVSGVAVDANDNVYIFTRAEPPVQVYDAKGKYLRGWGTDGIKSAHHIKIDGAGNVWIADIGNHVVE